MPETTATPNAHGYIADFGDWVRLGPDGAAATIINATLVSNGPDGRDGHSYRLMFKGGHESTLDHWDGDDHLTNSRGTTMPLFVIVDQA